MSENVMRASDVSGLPVVTCFDGEDVAEVRDVVYDAEAHRLVGFTLNKRGIFAGRMKDVLPAESLVAIGAHAVMIEHERDITESSTPDALDNASDAVSVIGATVLSAEGNELGQVAGVIISTGEAPAAVGYEIEPTDGGDAVFVPISAQMALSGENLLLPESATDFIRNDLAGFGAAVTDYRARTLDGSH